MQLNVTYMFCFIYVYKLNIKTGTKPPTTRIYYRIRPNKRNWPNKHTPPFFEKYQGCA